MEHLPSDALLGDIDAMFCAVTARLRRIAAAGTGEASAVQGLDGDDRLRAGVLECVGALDQLHALLAHEIERRHQLEQIVGDAQAALARSPPELVAMLGVTLRVPPVGRRLAAAPDRARDA
jgi:hypothetical protein